MFCFLFKKKRFFFGGGVIELLIYHQARNLRKKNAAPHPWRVSLSVLQFLTKKGAMHRFFETFAEIISDRLFLLGVCCDLLLPGTEGE